MPGKLMKSECYRNEPVPGWLTGGVSDEDYLSPVDGSVAFVLCNIASEIRRSGGFTFSVRDVVKGSLRDVIDVWLLECFGVDGVGDELLTAYFVASVLPMCFPNLRIRDNEVLRALSHKHELKAQYAILLFNRIKELNL